jgi:glycosyltransferase involved in cell wall biosynthesis
MPKSKSLLSIIVPIYNESDGLNEFHASLVRVLNKINIPHEILYCDDGSKDDTVSIVKDLHQKDPSIRLVKLSRNFGKESALAAGISEAKGSAMITIDGDGQHPVEAIPEFVKAWKAGAKVVVGLSKPYQREGLIKRAGSALFYRLFNLFSSSELLPGASDYRLIDKDVQSAFKDLKETNRITRGLIDWIGFEPAYISYVTKPRTHGKAHYSNRKLLALATNSFVSMSAKPLYLFSYFGVFITIASLLLGLSIIAEQLILSDPLGWKFTGTAMLGVLILFLVGIVLMSQGMIALYVSNIHTESKERPLYVIDTSGSIGIDFKTNDQTN